MGNPELTVKYKVQHDETAQLFQSQIVMVNSNHEAQSLTFRQFGIAKKTHRLHLPKPC